MTLYLITIGWLYVTLMMAAAEATAPGGSLLGALLTFALYGLLPLAIVLYIGMTPARRAARGRREAAGSQQGAHGTRASDASAAAPDQRGVAPGDAVAPEREEA